ncbi:hypothetical protein FOL47_004479 [Perkinsus chesapeaki]|uniref:Uncharacterized protein n=1 Tax=Perkinsus chesapeaki TaxID=330153 RepID=A0A7J6M2I2_PERCH|nr:hypothetical protein FOL47_004479 [Perkinsus chesapeaki]
MASIEWPNETIEWLNRSEVDWAVGCGKRFSNVFCPRHSHLLPSPTSSNEEDIISPETSPSSCSVPEETLDESCAGQPKDIIELGTSSSDEDEKEVALVEKPKPKTVLPTYISVTAPGNPSEVTIKIAITDSVVEGHNGDESGLVREVKKGVVTAMLSWKDMQVEKSVVLENGRGLLKVSFVDNTIVTAKSVCKIMRSLKAAQISYGKKIEKISGAKQPKLAWFLSELDISGTNLNPMEVGEVSSLLMKLGPSLWPSVHSVPLSFRALRMTRLSSGGKMPAAAKLKTAGVDVEIGRTEEAEPDLLIGAVSKRKARTVGRRGRRMKRVKQSVQWRPMKSSSDSENEGLKDTLRQAADFELRLKREDMPKKDTNVASAPGRFSLSKLLGAQTVYQKNIRQPLKGLSYLGAPPRDKQRHAPQNYQEKRPPEQSTSSSSSRADVSIDSAVVNFVAHICKDRRLVSWPSKHFDEEVRKVSRWMVEKYSCLLPLEGDWESLIEKRKKRLVEWIEEKICSRRVVGKHPGKMSNGNGGAKFLAKDSPLKEAIIGLIFASISALCISAGIARAAPGALTGRPDFFGQSGYLSIGGGGVFVPLINSGIFGLTAPLGAHQSAALSVTLVTFAAVAAAMVNIRSGLVDYGACLVMVPAANAGTIIGERMIKDSIAKFEKCLCWDSSHFNHKTDIELIK